MNEAEFERHLAAEGDTGRSEYALDTDNAEHTHDFSFAAFVLSGSFSLVIDEGKRSLGPGDMWSLEAGSLHADRLVGVAPVTFLYGVKK